MSSIIKWKTLQRQIHPILRQRSPVSGRQFAVDVYVSPRTGQETVLAKYLRNSPKIAVALSPRHFSQNGGFRERNLDRNIYRTKRKRNDVQPCYAF